MTLDGSNPLRVGGGKTMLLCQIPPPLPVLCVARFSPAHTAQSWDSTKDAAASHGRPPEPVIRARSRDQREDGGSE